MRENILRVRMSDIERDKLKRLEIETGLVGAAETIRYFIDHAYDEVVLKLRNRPCSERPTTK